MPGPANLVTIYIKQNEWFRQISENLQFAQELGSILVNGNIQFKINENFQIGRDTTWHTKKEITVAGKHVRINKEFVPSAPKIMIRYPFEMSQVSVQKAIGIGEQAPFAIKYRNVSSIDLGAQSDEKRILRIVFELLGGVRGCDIMFLGWTSVDKFPMEEPYVHEIEYMPKKSEASFSGSFAFAHPDIPAFASARIRGSLFIGHVNNPRQEFIKIQERNFSVQYTIQFEPVSEAELILMTTIQTTPELLEKWKKFGRDFHFKFDVWNVGYYKTASYFKQTHTGKSLAEHAENKLIVILNDTFQKDQGGGTTSTMAFLHKDDILDAAIHHKVSTLVVGNEWGVDSAVEPLKARKKVTHHDTVDNFIQTIKREGITFEEDHKIAVYLSFCCCRPSIADLDGIARKMKNKIIQKLPFLQFTFVTVSSYRVIRKSCPKKRRLGYLVVRKKLGAAEPRVGSLLSDPNFENVTLNVLRSIPLVRRFKMLQDYEDHARRVLELSFIGDYIDEFNDVKNRGEATTLVILETFRNEIEREKVQNNPRLKLFLATLFSHFEWLGHSYFTSARDKKCCIWFCCKRSNSARLAQRLKPKLQSLKRHFRIRNNALGEHQLYEFKEDLLLISKNKPNFSHSCPNVLYSERNFGGTIRKDEDSKEGDSEFLEQRGGEVEQQKGMFYKKCDFSNEKERARAIMEALEGFGNKDIYELQE